MRFIHSAFGMSSFPISVQYDFDRRGKNDTNGSGMRACGNQTHSSRCHHAKPLGADGQVCGAQGEVGEQKRGSPCGQQCENRPPPCPPAAVVAGRTTGRSGLERQHTASTSIEEEKVGDEPDQKHLLPADRIAKQEERGCYVLKSA